MNRNRIKSRLVFFGLWLVVLFPLSAQSGANSEGYDYDGKAITAILPFIGEEDAAGTFNQATVEAVTGLQKYSPRRVNIDTVQAAGVRIPTDMPPIRELVRGVRYALTGGVYPGTYENEYYLQLWLWDMSNSSMIYTDDLVYQNIDEGVKSLPGLVEWLFSHIVEVTVESESEPENLWEDKRLTIGVRSGVSHRWYTAPDENAPGASALVYEGGVFMSVLLNSLLAIQAEVNFTYDDLVYREIINTAGPGSYTPTLTNEKRSTYSLMFPLIMKANFRPANFRIAPFAGVYAFLPLGEASYRINPDGKTESFSWSVPVPLGYTLGVEAAVKCGPGILLADIRYAGDFDTITIYDNADTAYKRHYNANPAYRRGMLSFTLGYAFGFINLKK
jgi:hypothetical protein